MATFSFRSSWSSESPSRSFHSINNRHVVCGRGKDVNEHPGNIHFQTILKNKLDEYSKAASKAEKSRIVSFVYDQIVSEGGFVRKDETGWYTVKEMLAREKISQGKVKRNGAAKYYVKSSKQTDK